MAISVTDIFPTGTAAGTVVQAVGPLGSDWIEMKGQAVLKAAYSALTGVGGALYGDPYQLEASSLVLVKSGIGNTNGSLATRENQMGYGGGKYWVMSQDANNPCWYSTDAINWSSSASFGANIQINGIIYAASLGLYIAYGVDTTAGAGAKIWSSPDLNTWTLRFNASSSGTGFCHGCWNGSTFVIFQGGLSSSLAFSGGCITSTDGINWSYRTISGTGSLDMTSQSYVAWFSDFSTFVATYKDASNHVIATSPDGITWTTRLQLATSSYGPVRKVIQAGSRLVAFGDSDPAVSQASTIRYSDTPTTGSWSYQRWTPTQGTLNIKDGVWNGEFVLYVSDSTTGQVAANVNNCFYISYDGVSLQPISSNVYAMPNADIGGATGAARVIWTGNMFITSGGYSLQASYDGRNWFYLQRTPGTQQAIWAGGRLVTSPAASGVYIYTSVPKYNTANYVWVPQRTRDGLPLYLKGK